MITPEKIDEWIHEAEERPSSAPTIIRFIALRLKELSKWNEDLLRENLDLNSGKKVEEYESRIASLEYQIELLKRQLRGEISQIDLKPSSILEKRLNPDYFSILIYNASGLIFRFEMNIANLLSGINIAYLHDANDITNHPLRILTATANEEILLVFDTGRTVTMHLPAIPASDKDNLNWQKAYLHPPLGTEELAFLKPIGRIGLYEYCIQISRKGCVKKVKESLFQSYLGKSYIGTGILSSPDKTFDMVFSDKQAKLIIVSQEGFLQALDTDDLPATIGMVQKLNITDHVIAAFKMNEIQRKDKQLLFITQNGKVITRSLDWIESAKSFQTKGQQVFSQARREAGIRLIYAGLVNSSDWGIGIDSAGNVICYQIGELLGAGTLARGSQDISILGFSVFRPGNDYE